MSAAFALRLRRAKKARSERSAVQRRAREIRRQKSEDKRLRSVQRRVRARRRRKQRRPANRRYRRERSVRSRGRRRNRLLLRQRPGLNLKPTFLWTRWPGPQPLCTQRGGLTVHLRNHKRRHRRAVIPT